MNHPYITAFLVRDHHDELRRQVGAARLRREARDERRHKRRAASR